MWSDVYTGQLTAELADKMVVDLQLGRLGPLAGFYSEGGNFDMAMEELNFQGLPLLCNGFCGEDERDQIFVSMKQWLKDLMEIGEPVDTNMRGMFVQVEINHLPKDEFILPDTLRNMAIDPLVYSGAAPCRGTKTFLIEDKEVLSQIRSYRQDLRA